MDVSIKKKGELNEEFLEDHIFEPKDDYLILVCCSTDKRGHFLILA